MTKSITNQIGDKGSTWLFSGEEVSKGSLRIDVLGDIDELSCVLSIARHHIQKNNFKEDIIYLQRLLCVLASEIATTPDKLDSLPKRIDESVITKFEQKREALAKITNLPKKFVIPGNTLPSAYLDQARTIARRCERKAVKLFEQKEITNRSLIVWLNRLSDYLYLMARCEEGTPLLVKE